MHPDSFFDNHFMQIYLLLKFQQPAVRTVLFPFMSKDFTQDRRQMSNKATEFYKTQIMFTEFSFDCCLCFTLETKNQFLLVSSFQLRPLAVVQLVCRTSFHDRVNLCNQCGTSLLQTSTQHWTVKTANGTPCNYANGDIVQPLVLLAVNENRTVPV